MALKTIFLSIVLGVSLVGTHAMAVEEPAFKVILQEGAFQIRDYPAQVVAEVRVSGDQKEAASKGFRLLAGYIFGGNKRRPSITMTAPDTQAPASEKIAMTAPVTQTQSAGEWVVRFTMPSAYSMQTLPEPSDPNVHLRLAPPTRFAVLRFTGVAGKDNVAETTADLQRLADAHHLRQIGPASLAQYDPPWTLWFMRRNEVMIPVAP